MVGVGVVACSAAVAGDADQRGADGAPLALRQGDGGQGIGVPGGGGHCGCLAVCSGILQGQGQEVNPPHGVSRSPPPAVPAPVLRPG